MEANGLIYCSTPSATFGVVVAAGRVTDTAPWGRRLGLVGRDAREVWREQARRGAQLEWIQS